VRCRWLGEDVMLAKETTVNYVLEEQRIENAYQAREMCEENTWGFNYWNNVLGALTRRLNSLVNQ
jgi:hypothetical protein